MAVNLAKLFLSAQRALLGNVSSKLRAVCVHSEENILYMYFYYDGEISENDRELSAHTIDQVIADFWEDDEGREIEFCMPIQRIDYPEKMPLIGDWVYHRYEP